MLEPVWTQPEPVWSLSGPAGWVSLGRAQAAAGQPQGPAQAEPSPAQAGPGPGLGIWKSGNPKYIKAKNENSQNQNPRRLKIRQGLE